MALARIITRSRQDVESLAEQLRARGYAVEIVIPGEPGSGPAELEIVADTCTAGEALMKGRELAREGHVDVLVAPGILEPEAAPAIPEPIESEPEVVGETRAECDARVPTSAEPRPMEAPEPRVPRRKVFGEALTAFAGAVGDIGEQVGDSLLQSSHRLAGRIAAARVNRRQRQEETRRRRALAIARRPIAQQPPVVTPISPPAAVPQAAAPVAVSHRPLPQIENFRTPSREREWKLAAIFSAAVAIAIMLAWVAATHKASSPLPAGMIMRSNSMQQRVPFGPVTLRPPASVSAPPVSAPAKAQIAPPAVSAARTSPSRDDDGVTVRHFTPAKPAARTTQSRSGVKYFSDFE